VERGIDSDPMCFGAQGVTVNDDVYPDGTVRVGGDVSVPRKDGGLVLGIEYLNSSTYRESAVWFATHRAA